MGKLKTMRELQRHVITEGVMGTYHYHYSDSGHTARSLCGEHTMPTKLPLSSWGYVGQLGERYCKSCELLHTQKAKGGA